MIVKTHRNAAALAICRSFFSVYVKAPNRVRYTDVHETALRGLPACERFRSAMPRYFNQDRKILELDRQGKERYMRHICLLVSLELWHRSFIA